MTSRLLLLAEFKVLAARDDELLLGFALLALETQGDFLRRLGLFKYRHHSQGRTLMNTRQNKNTKPLQLVFLPAQTRFLFFAGTATYL